MGCRERTDSGEPGEAARANLRKRRLAPPRLAHLEEEGEPVVVEGLVAPVEGLVGPALASFSPSPRGFVFWSAHLRHLRAGKVVRGGMEVKVEALVEVVVAVIEWT